MKISRQQIAELVKSVINENVPEATPSDPSNIFGEMVKADPTWLNIRNDLAERMTQHSEWTATPRELTSTDVMIIIDGQLGLNSGGVDEVMVEDADSLIDALSIVDVPGNTEKFIQAREAIKQWADDNGIGEGQGLISRGLFGQERLGKGEETYAEQEPPASPPPLPEAKIKITRAQLNNIVRESIHSFMND